MRERSCVCAWSTFAYYKDFVNAIFVEQNFCDTSSLVSLLGSHYWIPSLVFANFFPVTMPGGRCLRMRKPGTFCNGRKKKAW